MTGYEPADVGPIAGGDRAVAPADRQLAINLLNAALADNRLNPADHQARVQAAERAQTFDDLIPLTRDLMGLSTPYTPSPGQAVAAAGEPDAHHQHLAQLLSGLPVPSSDGKAGATIVGIFGSSVRRGQWVAPSQVTTVAVFGGNDIDLTEAQWEAPVIEITVTALFGGVEIKLPRGTKVDNQAIGIFGGVDVKGPTDGSNGLCLVLKGMCLFGGVSVKAK